MSTVAVTSRANITSRRLVSRSGPRNRILLIISAHSTHLPWVSLPPPREPAILPLIPIRPPIPPPGVDAQAFYDLVEARKRGWADNLLAINKAANNTSVVFCLEWRGWKLLFPGDAELRSWQIMNREKVLKPVDFLKVGHHGSHNATPPEELLEKILPQPNPAGRPRSAAVST